MNVRISKLKKNAIIPTRGSDFAAGYDLYACIDQEVHIAPGETVKIGTGVSMAIPIGYFGAIFARSGLATKKGLRPANAVGVCDADYRGEYIVALHNDSNKEQIVEIGERIAQLIIIPFASIDFIETQTLDQTDRGSKGFGSTGAH